ncbi:C-terminal helicase domain-containing protein, partial [Neisseria gonorrhoeae]
TEPQFDEEKISPKEADMLEVVKDSLAKGRKCLVYTVYTDTRDTTGRLKEIFKRHGIKAAVMKATVKADQREDWVEDQLASGVQVVICNPELVKTGLDLLAFPTIYFLQTGYNVYTLMQAARRSWRIGQKEDVEVYFAGYSDTAQQICLELMGQKVAVTQSTSGDMPDSGLDILNQAEDSVEVQLAKRFVDRQD